MKIRLATKLLSLFLLFTILTSTFVFFPTNVQAAGELKVHMLAYGDKGNDCFIVELPNGQRMVIDVQDSPTLLAELNRLNIGSIKYLVGTHQHGDHIEGMNNFLNSGFTINNTEIYYPKGAINTTNLEYDYMVNAANSRNLTVKKLVKDDYILNTTYNGKALVIRVLAPIESKIDGIGTNDYTDVNDASLVIRVKYGTKSILFMGDAREPTEMDLINNTDPDVLNNEVIKIGHHGLKSGYTFGGSDAFLDIVQPKMALITNSEHDIGLPVVENLQERNITYFSTGQYGVLGGHVTLSTDGTNPWYSNNEPYWPSSLPQTTYYFIEDKTGAERLGNNQENNGDDVTMTDAVWWSKYTLRWQLKDAGEGYYYIENMDSDKLLFTTTTGSDVYVVPNTDTSDNVKWQLVDIDGTYKYIVNKANGMKLYSSTAESWLVRMESAAYTGDTAKWKLNLVPFGS